MEFYSVVVSECHNANVHIFTPRLFTNKEDALKLFEKLYKLCLDEFVGVTPDVNYYYASGRFSIVHEDTYRSALGLIEKCKI